MLCACVREYASPTPSLEPLGCRIRPRPQAAGTPGKNLKALANISFTDETTHFIPYKRIIRELLNGDSSCDKLSALIGAPLVLSRSKVKIPMAERISKPKIIFVMTPKGVVRRVKNLLNGITDRIGVHWSLSTEETCT